MGDEYYFHKYKDYINKKEDDSYINFCRTKIRSYLPNCDLEMLQDYFIFVLYILKNSLYLNIDTLFEQLSMNNDRDIYGIINLFLPFIETGNHKHFTNPINFVESDDYLTNKPKFSNYIFDHNIINNVKNWTSYDDKYPSKQIIQVVNTKNKIRGLINNDQIYYYSISIFVFETIFRTRYKLFINWINIFPIAIENYKFTNLYNNSFKTLGNNMEYNIDNTNNILSITLKKVIKKDVKDKNIYNSAFKIVESDKRVYNLRVNSGIYDANNLITEINILLSNEGILWEMSYCDISEEFYFSFTDTSVNDVKYEYISLFNSNIDNSIMQSIGFVTFEGINRIGSDLNRFGHTEYFNSGLIFNNYDLVLKNYKLMLSNTEVIKKYSKYIYFEENDRNIENEETVNPEALNFLLYNKQRKINDCIFEYFGINLEDIYNTFVNDYYKSIEGHKWFIFEFVEKDNIILYIKFLDDMNLLNEIINNDYLIISKSNFNRELSKFTDYVRRKSDIILKNIKYSSENVIKVFIYLILNFEKNYSKISIVNKNEKLINDISNVNDYEEDIYSNKFIEISNNNITFFEKEDNDVKVIKEILFESLLYVYDKFNYKDYIFDFLTEQIEYLKCTTYNNLLFEDNTLKDLSYKRIDLNNILNPDNKYTLKNVYNFGKSLSILNKNRLCTLWDGLSYIERVIVCLRLDSNTNKQNWFKINKYLERLGYNPNQEARGVSKFIYKKIRDDIIDLTFQNLIYKGCISEFQYHPEVSNKSKEKNFLQNFRQLILSKENRELYENAYYFANNKKYRDQIEIKTFENGKVLKYDSYIEYIFRVNPYWNSQYGLDWISQIAFNLRFLNQRVMYITGSTGVGKSTQVPKLYLYSLKAFLYKNNGRVFCSVPRIDPVEENADTISEQLGLHIKTYDDVNFKKQIKSLNTTVQFKHSKDNHINENGLFLRLVTDGVLLEMLKKNQVMKKTVKTRKDETFSSEYEVTEYNECDVILVDEAHEHNTNMDLILTIARYTLIYNNDIKLGIISATMENDEDKYRNYYRLVDDNLSYPVNTFNMQYKLDRHVIDRRLHISAPGTTTKFNIKEIYDDENYIDTYEKNEELALKKLDKIFKETDTGDVLLFSNSVNSIKNIVNKMNSSGIQGNIIILPYFGEMKENFKKYCKKPSKNLINLDVDKKDIFDYFKGDKTYDQVKKVSKNTYNRACIVATNVAEASLTISSLKYVIDIGFQINIKYNYDSQISEVNNNKINEVSRVQRKGRVGRVGGGTVYYMYPKGSRENVNTSYAICNENFNDSYLELLTSNNNSDSEIINPDLLIKIISLEKIPEKSKDFKKQFPNLEKMNSIIKVIAGQYKIFDEFYENLAEERDVKFEYDILKYLLPTYKTGFINFHLNDKTGLFYLIHPLDNDYKRDNYTFQFINNNKKFLYLTENQIKKIYYNNLIKSEIIKYGEDKNDLFLLKDFSYVELSNFSSIISEYDKYFTKLLVFSMIFDKNRNKNIYFKDNDKNNYKNIYNINDHYFLHLNIFIYFVLKNIDNDIVKLSKNLSYKCFDSELEIFYKIFDTLSKLINYDKLKNDNKYRIEYIYNILKSNINNITYNDLIKIFYKINLNDSKDIDIFNKIIKYILKKNTRIIDDLQFDDEVNYVTVDRLKNNKLINNYCKINNLNYNVIISSLSEYYKYLEKIRYKNFYDQFDRLRDIYKFKTYAKDLYSLKIIYLNVYQTNLFYNENGIYYDLFSNKVFNLSKYNNIKHSSKIGFYLSKNIKNNNLNILFLSNITKEDLLENIPLIVTFTKNKARNYINLSTIRNNIDYLTKKINNSYGKEFKLNNEIYTFKNILNVFLEKKIKQIKLYGGANKYKIYYTK